MLRLPSQNFCSKLLISDPGFLISPVSGSGGLAVGAPGTAKRGRLLAPPDVGWWIPGLFGAVGCIPALTGAGLAARTEAGGLEAGAFLAARTEAGGLPAGGLGFPTLGAGLALGAVTLASSPDHRLALLHRLMYCSSFSVWVEPGPFDSKLSIIQRRLPGGSRASISLVRVESSLNLAMKAVMSLRSPEAGGARALTCGAPALPIGLTPIVDAGDWGFGFEGTALCVTGLATPASGRTGLIGALGVATFEALTLATCEAWELLELGTEGAW